MARAAIVWLGLSTSAWIAALACDLWLRSPPSDLPAAAKYLPALALIASCLWSVPVLGCHAAVHVLARRGLRVWPWIAAALGLAVLLPVYELSATLVEGAWISEQPYAGAVRLLLLALLLGGWQLLWLWHAWGAAPALRARWQPRGQRARVLLQGAFWIAGVASLAGAFVALGGVLRPYAPLAERLVFPSWLIAATLAFRLYERHARLAVYGAAGVLAAAGVALSLCALAPKDVVALRAHVLGAGGWAGLTEQLVRSDTPGRLGRFDFRHARSRPCPGPQRAPELALADARRRNVILLSIDSVRRDAVGKRFGGRAVAPNLEAFAAQSIFFERAVAPAPITLYSLGSLLTGHSVSQLLWLAAIPDNLFRRTRKLFDRQYAVLSDWPVLRRPRLTSLIKQGTPTAYVPRDKDPGELFRTQLSAARARGERIFFWLHLDDPHAPYHEHEGFDFGASQADRYYGEVAYADAALGRVLDHLRATGYFDDSLIVVFSDHGESLGEGGYFGHGISVLGRFTDVPLYVRYPGVTARRSRAPVSLTQIASSVLHYLNQPIPPSFAGCSLLASDTELERCPLPVSSVHGVGTSTFDEVLREPVRSLADLKRRQKRVGKWRRFDPDVAITSADHRYVFNLANASERLYRRDGDPLEQHNLVTRQPALVRAFRARLAQWRQAEARRIVCQLAEEPKP